LDNDEAFSPIAKMIMACIFFIISILTHWSLHRLDIKNDFLHGSLEKDIDMEQPPDFVAQRESRLVVN